MAEKEAADLEDEGKESLLSGAGKNQKRSLEFTKERPSKKRRKGKDNSKEQEVVWGEEIRRQDPAKVEFLAGGSVLPVREVRLKQILITPIPMSQVVVNGIMKDIIKKAVEVSKQKEKVILDEEIKGLVDALENDDEWPKIEFKKEKAKSKEEIKKPKKEEDFMLRMLKVRERRK